MKNSKTPEEWSESPVADAGKPLSELSPNGLLWLINASTFWPRGFSLALIQGESGDIVGWEILGDGTEVWQASSPERADELLVAAEGTLNSFRNHG